MVNTNENLRNIRKSPRPIIINNQSLNIKSRFPSIYSASKNSGINAGLISQALLGLNNVKYAYKKDEQGTTHKYSFFYDLDPPRLQTTEEKNQEKNKIKEKLKKEKLKIKQKLEKEKFKKKLDKLKIRDAKIVDKLLATKVRNERRAKRDEALELKKPKSA
jgi:DNA-binding transcriptional MocR family regulator